MIVQSRRQQRLEEQRKRVPYTTEPSDVYFKAKLPTALTSIHDAPSESLTSPSSYSNSSSNSTFTTRLTRSISLSPDGVRYIPSSSTSISSEQQQDGCREFMTVYEIQDIEQQDAFQTQKEEIHHHHHHHHHSKPRALFQSSVISRTTQKYSSSHLREAGKKSHVFLLPSPPEDDEHPTFVPLLTETRMIIGSSITGGTTNKLQLENNVHEKSVVKTKRVKFASKELDENEMYANQVGLHFSPDRGDFFSFPETHLIHQESTQAPTSPTISSPQHGKADQDLTFRALFGDLSQMDQSLTSPMASSIYAKSKRSYYPNVLSSHQSPVAHHLITPQTRRNMVENEEDVVRLRKRASQLCIDWASPKYVTPSVARRLRDFEFAQEKRSNLHGNRAVKWGVIGLYDFLTSVRTDIEWAEDVGNRRALGLPYKPWMEFAKQKTTGHNRPFVTIFIITSTAIAFLCSIGLNHWTIEKVKINPMIGPSADTLVRMGAKDSDLIVNEFQWWRLITTTFLHAGLIHFLMNCLAIYYVCRPVEQNHGSKAVSFIFLISSVGANVISATFMPEYVTVGASGGIFGLIGCCLADILLNRRLIFSDFVNKGRSRAHHICVTITLIIDLAINVLCGLTPMIDNFTHLGGLLFGFLCGFCLMDTLEFDNHKTRYLFFQIEKISCFKLISSITSIAILVACITLLYIGDGVTSPCPPCKVLSCVPFPWWGSNKWYTCDYDNCSRAVVQGVTLNDNGDITSVEMTCPNHHQAIYYVNMSTVFIETWIQESYVNICRKICTK